MHLFEYIAFSAGSNIDFQNIRLLASPSDALLGGMSFLKMPSTRAITAPRILRCLPPPKWISLPLSEPGANQ
jgi:hypothetical protein